jgi:uncharacterized protein YoxC
MNINWMSIVIVSVCAIALILFLIKQNKKDKKEVTKYFNTETKIEKESEPDEDEI